MLGKRRPGYGVRSAVQDIAIAISLPLVIRQDSLLLSLEFHFCHPRRQDLASCCIGARKQSDCIRASIEVTGNGLPVTGLQSKCAKPCYTWILQRRASNSTKSENNFSTSPNSYADSKGAPIGGNHLPDSACPLFRDFHGDHDFHHHPTLSSTRFIIVHGRFGEGAGTSGGCASKQERSTCGREVQSRTDWSVDFCTLHQACTAGPGAAH